MKKKKWILPVCIVAAAAVLCIGAVLIFDAVLNAQGYSVSVGRLYFSDDGTYLIDSDDKATLVLDCTDNAELFKGYESGDKIVLLHDGVEQSAPARTGGYRIFRLAKTDRDYVPKQDVFLPKVNGLDEMFDDAQKIDFTAQYIRTSMPKDDIDYPQVTYIGSLDELVAYYNDNWEKLGLGKISDSFFTATKKYDAEFFGQNAIILTLLEEGSGSISHNVESVRVDGDGTLYLKILSISPEVGTCDMAYWHIVTEVKKDKVPSENRNIVVFYNDSCVYNNSPQYSEVPEGEQTEQKEPFGYCGNTQTTIYFEDMKTGQTKSFTFMGGESVEMTDILLNLEYDKKKMCKCMAEYSVQTEFGKYSINISDSYARFDGGQAELTSAQTQSLGKIIEWAREKAR